MEAGETQVKVWDAPVRLFHWLLVLLFAFMFFTGKSAATGWSAYAHRLRDPGAGAVRILWASQAALTRVFQLPLGPSACIECVKHLLARKPSPTWTQPLGGWMVLVLCWRCCSRQVPACCQDDLLRRRAARRLISKAMSDQLTTIHSWNFNLLLLLAGLHVIACCITRAS